MCTNQAAACHGSGTEAPVEWGAAARSCAAPFAGLSKRPRSRMPSRAYTTHLSTVLADAVEINQGHASLRTGAAGRQYGLGALNRAVVVMCVAAWEVYVEEVVKECLALLRPPAAPLGVWPALNATVRSQVGRFNNPNVQHTRDLIRDCIGLLDITASWAWQGTSSQRARERLEEAITLRHQVAHGVTPRPIIHNQQYARRLPGLFERLGTRTDAGITAYLDNEFGIQTGW